MIIIPNSIVLVVGTWLTATCWFKRHEISRKLFDEGDGKNV
ncbi:hypothetical protein MUDAN_DOGOELCO_03312 [Lactiplantibacillus mudanjiangensis]|nr:hypothetical protein MUDAN_DOGOELCO_03312 [Lactiplantibacillus mudanjiangensis]